MANEQSGIPLRRWRPFYGAFVAIDEAIEAAGHPRAAFEDVRCRILQLLRAATDDGVAEQLCAALDDAMVEALQTLRVAPVPHRVLASTDLARALRALGKHESPRIRSLAGDVQRGWKTAIDKELNKFSDDRAPPQHISTAVKKPVIAQNEKTEAKKQIVAQIEKIGTKKPVAAQIEKMEAKKPITAAQLEKMEVNKPIAVQNEKTEAKKQIVAQREKIGTKKPVAAQIEKMEAKKPITAAQLEKMEAKKPITAQLDKMEVNKSIAVQNEKIEAKKQPIITQSEKMETTKRKLFEGYEEAKKAKRQHTSKKIDDKEASKIFEQSQRKMLRAPARCRISSGVRRSLRPTLQLV